MHDAETKAAIMEVLYEQYYLCRSYAFGEHSMFECRYCRFVEECPVYGTKNYVKRQLEYCTRFTPWEDDAK